MASHHPLLLRFAAAAGWRVFLLLQQLAVCHLLLLKWGLCAWASAAGWVTYQTGSSTQSVLLFTLTFLRTSQRCCGSAVVTGCYSSDGSLVQQQSQGSCKVREVAASDRV